MLIRFTEKCFLSINLFEYALFAIFNFPPEAGREKCQPIKLRQKLFSFFLM